jgi:hypothetical protein
MFKSVDLEVVMPTQQSFIDEVRDLVTIAQDTDSSIRHRLYEHFKGNQNALETIDSFFDLDFTSLDFTQHNL